MTMARSWKDVRAERKFTAEDEARIAEIRRQMAAEERAYALAEVRKAQGVTQDDLAAAMHVSQARVSAIEHGDLDRSNLSTVQSYVEALGGHVEVVADFGDQRLVLG